MKINLKKVAVAATITGISLYAAAKMFHVKRPKLGISGITSSHDNLRFSHQYPEPGQSVKPEVCPSYMQPVGEEHFVNEELDKPKKLTRSFSNDQ